MRTMEKLIRENVNTKMEIKNGTKTLTQQINVMARLIREAEAEMEDFEHESRVERKATRDMGIQVDIQEKIEITVEKEKKERLNHIREVLEAGGDFAALEPVLDMIWPEEALETVSNIQNDPFKGDHGKDLVIFTSSSKRTTPRIKGFVARYLEIHTMEIDFLKVYTKAMQRGGAIKESEKTIYIALYEKSERGFTDVENFYKCVVLCKQAVMKQECKDLVFSVPVDMSKLYARKILEFLFYNTGVKATLTGGKREVKGSADVSLITKSKRMEETLIVKAGSRSFADLRRRYIGIHSIEYAGDFCYEYIRGHDHGRNPNDIKREDEDTAS